MAALFIVLFIVAAWDVTKTAVKGQHADFQAQLPAKKPGKSGKPGKGSGAAPKVVGTKQPSRARHATGYWTGEAVHGFPVFRNGWWAGWLAHKSARNQQRSVREQARTTHLQGLAEHLRVLREQRELQRQAHEEIQVAIKTADQPPKGRKEVREEVAKVLPFTRRDPAPLPSETVGKPQPGPYAPKDDPRLNDAQRERDAEPRLRNICAACGRPGTADNPLVIAEGYRVHRSKTTELGDGSRRLGNFDPDDPGDPRSPAYEEPPDEEALENDPVHDVPHRRSGYDPDDPALDLERERDLCPPSPATNGGNMPTGTGSDTTYTSVLADAKAAHAQADEDTATIQKRMDDAYAQADQMAAANVDPAVIDEQMSYADSLKAAHQALSQAGEHAGSTAAQAERYHGGMQEAVDNAPGKVAERQFHESG